jgi:hypothetical protein
VAFAKVFDENFKSQAMISESLTIAILGIAAALLSGVISFVLGQRAERHKQSLIIRAEMLKPIDEWLKGVERMVGILSDTLASVALNSPLPVSYNLDERRKASNFMAEKTNEIFGIIASESLQIRETKRLSKELGDVIRSLDSLIKFELLPRESNVVDRSNNGTLTNEYMLEVVRLKVQLDALLQKAYSLAAQIKTSLT